MTDEPRVVSINGGEVPKLGNPIQSCIELLEDLLERARSGEMQALGVVSMDKDGVSSYQLTGLIGSYCLIGATSLLHLAICEECRV